MSRVTDLYDLYRCRLLDQIRRIFIGTKHLELISSLDRKLARLSRKRDRELGILAHGFLNTTTSVTPPAQFIDIITELKRLELERSLPIVDSSSSLTSLVIPDTKAFGESNVSDMELVHPEERDDLYRRRLRGVYMDLGELILTHSIRDEFKAQSDVIEQIRTQIVVTRQERERITDLLPSSTRVLTWLRFALVVFIAIVVLIVIF
jgi:hypothetical protein